MHTKVATLGFDAHSQSSFAYMDFDNVLCEQCGGEMVGCYSGKMNQYFLVLTICIFILALVDVCSDLFWYDAPSE